MNPPFLRLIAALLVWLTLACGSRLPAQAPGEGRKPGAIYTGKLGMKFAWIPPGTFLMGSSPDEKGHHQNETQHKVTLTKGIWMSVYPVTMEQWKKVMGKYPSGLVRGGDYPVVSVSWKDCQEFMKKLGVGEGQQYRLPTEAEWEYACRAGTITEFNTGNGEEALNKAGWYLRNSGDMPHPVGQKAPNAWGLYDMHGNVWQWCADWYGPYPNGAVTDPTGSKTGTLRVMRGGAWLYLPIHCRTAYRAFVAPDRQFNNGGFRVVLVPAVGTP
jgi:formylglycine-generating enzyme required for sulfatase activity